MLYIRHIPLQGEILQKNHYEVRATIIPYSDSAIIPDSVYVAYRYNQGPWHQVLMLPDTSYVWVGLIPDSIAPVDIHYYIHASDQSGRSENHPYIGIAPTESSRRDVLVYPNPCDDRLYAMIPNPDQQRLVVHLFTTAGVKVLSEAFSDARSLHQNGVGVQHLENGVYLFEVVAGSVRYRQKVMIVHQ
jgi:hypothetical protein